MEGLKSLVELVPIQMNIIILLLCLVAIVISQKNVILMIGDGFGPVSHTLGRTYLGRKTVFDKYHLGTVQTFSVGALITDSSASATAYACGKKTKNKYVAMDENGKVLKTILEGAREKGMKVGLVTTTSLQHATPASFSSHITNRDLYEEIATQQTSHHIDVMFGGGRRWMLPKNKGGDRTDGKDLLEVLEKRGVQVIRNAVDFGTARLRIPVAAYVAHDQKPMEIDRKPGEPSLLDFTKKAIELLNGTKPGFFLMVEGGRIDHALHQNDAGSAAREIQQFDLALDYTIEYAKTQPDTIVIATADHETGGMTIGYDGSGYNWYPNTLKTQVASTESCEKLIRAGRDIRSVVKDALKIDLNQEQFNRVVRARDTGEAISYHLGRAVGKIAGLGFTTVGHTGIDVHSQGYGKGTEALRGNVDNTDIGKFIIQHLQLNITGF